MDRQINSFYYERLLSSQNKKPVIQEAERQSEVLQPEGLIKDPYVWAFLNLDQQFDHLCEGVNNFAALNQVFEDLKPKKQRLLVVLQRPNTSLHNNDSERDIRAFVKRRKISGSTRSENGRKARDTFLSLKKTCRKLGVSFWDYLLDRLQNANHIPPLTQVMAQKPT